MIDNFLELEKRHLSLSLRRGKGMFHTSPEMFLPQCFFRNVEATDRYALVVREMVLQQKTEFVVAINLFNVNSNGRIIERLQKKNQWDICFT